MAFHVTVPVILVAIVWDVTRLQVIVLVVVISVGMETCASCLAAEIAMTLVVIEPLAIAQITAMQVSMDKRVVSCAARSVKPEHVIETWVLVRNAF